MSITLQNLPQELATLGQARWLQLSSHKDFNCALKDHEQLIVQAISLSDFIFEQISHKPDWLHALLIEEQLFAEQIDYCQHLSTTLATVEDELALHKTLRQFRNFHMLRIAWRDLLNMQPIENSLAQVSDLAIQLINQCNDWLYALLQLRFGTPEGEHGPQPMLVLGMGKLGGGELNFSSDIDLIFTYSAQGDTQGGKKSIEHQQFFIKLAQKLITALNQITADGQVYRVDMRLRPFGDSGPLVLHFDAMEDYYQEQGRDWERYAMLKARILNRPDAYTAELSQILRPFIYRRYLDFSAIDSLRTMKNMIQQEVRRRGLVNNIKLGQGGIREAEFVVQSLQLINGGREPSLQVQSLQRALSELQNLDILPQSSAEKILSSYMWLRKVEHCLQQFADKQTQVLPQNPIDQIRLNHVLGYQQAEDFMQALHQHHNCIHQQFLLLVKDEHENNTKPVDTHDQVAYDLWHLDLEPDEIEALFIKLAKEPLLTFSAEQLSDFYQTYITFKDNLQKRVIGQRGLSILNNLMPLVLKLIWSCEAHNPLTLQNRILTVLHGILGRTAYLQLLWENQGALEQLIRLCDASPWVTEQISRFPLLLDELLNPAALYQPVDKGQFSDELRQVFLRVEPDDLELQIETLRSFKLSQQLKIAAADISNALPIMQVSDYLTYLAEAIINQVVDLAWQQMVDRYGVPICQDTGPKTNEDKGFAILGFGKMGGWELGYGSDLDLVFIHDCQGNEGTNGKKSIESKSFYLKLAQRIVHIFTIKTGLGILYEVDMRLRPSGNAGLLVCHINGFTEYQKHDAWTWEHQALSRARFISGCQRLHTAFSQLRLAILSMPRVLPDLKKEVVDMREKMRTHLAKGTADYIDLKQDKGGIADIEFIVQFMLLAHTKNEPKLAKWTDNIRVLTSLATYDCLLETEVQTLTHAYLAYRNSSHRLALQNGQLAKSTPELLAHQQNVIAIWDKYLT
ncbi:bifunctional [glutamate--ammonia ligase]-adenylyl-L-tyrosine phosphorylase/[glutamate--ammonia-ligase] adenylyltransferase [Paraglaciecola aquimarina]|uniref:Bifunctional glutamine synthetase adenylyltransferase/adenylyl-removing enzyme n=1 Tax=Paraglaciecola aquimarina TaxID=1235557 RepID=A0ABU3T1U8_9ALTE|nr:bifunctional [glutamate--ammonia ligase]-adenylyl-L-tyrosine phosphorylase/[glutamate--ammonia-ligase] adenylyltransferase [Paraglaciecola aquimarina]MDU0356239.1 bifunctional [glutamate--ammonia ligase]-adenylyl-L-tyrosine phosphorylase/[glutamate--ammonia-ligase] adenylyltransferase [Paraglaciecola aquimarina]